MKRLAVSLVREIPRGTHLMARCGNKRCINPEHLRTVEKPRVRASKKMKQDLGMWAQLVATKRRKP